jgi:two-component SAPR family response regulator
MYKIAVIDDCVPALTYLHTVLTHIGHSVYTFNRPMEAILLIPAIKPDIIICDYIMLDMVGLDVIDALRDLNVKAKYILLTSLDDLNLIQICKEKNILFVHKDGTKTKILEGINV